MWRALLLTYVSLIPNIFAQQLIGGSTFGKQSYTSNICGKTTADANLTGLYSYNPHVSQLTQTGQPDNNSGRTLPVEWLSTISQTSGTNNASLQLGLWYSSTGANYSYDLGLGYDVCFFLMILENTNWFKRAINDNGDCTTAFDQTCVSDIEKQAQQYALEQTLDPTTSTIRSNLTADSVYTVCADIAQALEDNFPSSCKKFMNSSTPVAFDGGAFTSSNYSVLYEYCDITNSATDGTFHHLVTYNKYTANNPVLVNHWYSYLSYVTLPMLTIFMPIANAKARASFSITNAAAKLQCVRPTHIVGDSDMPSAAPTPTPYGSGGLSGGAIAGIVVGVIVAVALIAGIFFFFWRRKRRTQKLDTFEPAENGTPTAFTADAKERDAVLDTSQEHKPAVEAPDTAVTELSPETEVEKPGTDKRPIELEGDQDPVVEKEAPEPAVELPTDPPRAHR